MTLRAARTSTTATPRAPRLGERLRQLRVAAGLTQTDLAGDRFSKEYISQIERGKTRPTPETIEWLGLRLGVDAGFLASGVSADERAKAEAILTRADTLLEDHQFDDAIAEYARALPAVLGTGAVELHVRALNGEAMARAQCGDVKSALALLAEARGLVERTEFSDIDRAEVLYRLGVCRYMLSSISTAVSLFNEALVLAERSGLPSDELRLNVFAWRSRCYRRQRDYEAAREDVERALELAEAMHDARALGQAYFQASILAERGGHWVLARTYAEKAKAQYEELTDRANVGRLLNNLGGLEFLLGKPEQAIEHLKHSFAVALEIGRDEDAAKAVSSLAQVHLRTGDHLRAAEQALHALEIIGDRTDMIDEVGNARLVLGRALLEQDRLDEAETAFAAAEDAFAQLSSGSHRAAAWIAQGDLAIKRGDERRGAVLYRRAAETLQDFRF
ncbi:MAG: tetratricopeptide repeat protein [Actinomycetota bacterium]|jgi:tetratricopeptide (TPR) repeat protein/DNA-binding XRE family transcriptional regulator|nr:tetratricopeptide repeat protein [Actinomycetota bacterium]